jgi:hypothetical protein
MGAPPEENVAGSVGLQICCGLAEMGIAVVPNTGLSVFCQKL